MRVHFSCVVPYFIFFMLQVRGGVIKKAKGGGKKKAPKP